MKAPGARRGRPGDDGFTLVELVVTVAIVGMISVALAGIVLSYLRNTVDTEARLTESHDVQLAAAYWQRDVASIGVRSNVYDTTTHSFPLQQSVSVTASCPLPAGATPVVTLGWSEYRTTGSTDAPPTVMVTYASRPDGGVYELLRVRCGGNDSTAQVADSLVAPPELVCVQAGGGSSCTGTGDDVPVVVRLRMRVHDSSGRGLATYEATLSGERRQS